MEHIVVIDLEGVLYSVWSDELTGLYEVERGGVEVERASHVEFDNGYGKWVVLNPDGITMMIPLLFATREAALLYEREEIERRLQG